MRVLCSAVALEGHVRPLLPIASALAGAGHDVLVATGAESAANPRFAQLPDDERGAATFSQVIAPAKLPHLEHILSTWRPRVQNSAHGAPGRMAT